MQFKIQIKLLKKNKQKYTEFLNIIVDKITKTNIY